MKLRILISCIAALALLAPGTSVAAGEPRADLVGQAAPAGTGTRTIVITPATRWVNVTGGETVNFVVGDKAFAWNFNVASTVSVFQLNRVAPPGLLSGPVRAYVAPDPAYIGTD